MDVLAFFSFGTAALLEGGLVLACTNEPSWFAFWKEGIAMPAPRSESTSKWVRVSRLVVRGLCTGSQRRLVISD
jgi:hypothetical protein